MVCAESHLWQVIRVVFCIELWKAPCLQCLNAQGNQLTALSGEIIHCQTLSKVMFDCNELSFLPTQITKLPNLKYLSLSGNTLQALPNGSATLLLGQKYR